jgi:hypothetical protein
VINSNTSSTIAYGPSDSEDSRVPTKFFGVGSRKLGLCLSTSFLEACAESHGWAGESVGSTVGSAGVRAEIPTQDRGLDAQPLGPIDLPQPLVLLNSSFALLNLTADDRDLIRFGQRRRGTSDEPTPAVAPTTCSLLGSVGSTVLT